MSLTAYQNTDKASCAWALYPWKFSLRHALNFTNKLEVDTVITTGFWPLQYSSKPPACKSYIIANIIAVQLFFVLADQRRLNLWFSAWKGYRDGESCNNAVARSFVGKLLPTCTLDEDKPVFLLNSQNEQVYAPFFLKLRNDPVVNIPPSWKHYLPDISLHFPIPSSLTRPPLSQRERDVWERGSI